MRPTRSLITRHSSLGTHHSALITQHSVLRTSMIGYLNGTLKKLDATNALVAVNGVGYEVHISLQTYYRLEGKRDVEIEIYTHVREDALALYGFASSDEKLAFEKLIA